MFVLEKDKETFGPYQCVRYFTKGSFCSVYIAYHTDDPNQKHYVLKVSLDAGNTKDQKNIFSEFANEYALMT